MDNQAANAAVELVRPALKVVCSKLKQEFAHTSGRNGLNPEENTKHFQGKFLILVNCEEQTADSTGNEGSETGSMLLLREDGDLFETQATGTWTRWQGDWSRKERTIRSTNLREAMDEYELECCLEALHQACVKQVEGKKSVHTKAALARQEKLAALIRLI